MPDPVVSASDSELRAHIERILADHYEVDCEIGRGGMGIVYRARDRRLKRHVAIKLLPPELAFRSEIRSRFLREAETAAQLSHPNIVPIYAVDEKDGLVFFVMACVDGENLAKIMHDRGPLPVDDVRHVLREVADALAYAHVRKVVHRDIKPDNILIDRDTGRPMVTDFGIARAVTEGQDSRLTATGMAIGTPAYMSPEQSAGEREVDGRSDLYSLGVVGYQMLAGVLPFQAATSAMLLVKQITERATPVELRRPDAPPDLARAVMMLLEKEPAARFQSAQELVTALDQGRVPDRAPSPAPAPAPAAGPARAETPASAPYPAYVPTGGWGSAAVVAPVAAETYSAPTADEMVRWDAPIVMRFRKKTVTFAVVNAVFLVVALVGGPDLLGVTAIWAIFLAFQYAKVLSEGYDWRDVARQPRDRLFTDVVSETADEVKALWDPRTRDRVRERDRVRRQLRGPTGAWQLPAGAGTTPVAPPAPGALSALEAAALQGPRAADVRQAQGNRDEILRLVSSFPRAEQAQIGDVVPSARALYDKIVSLAAAAADLERSAPAESLAALEREVATLEAQANPLDRAASEERVRRLALLKRQRRALADVARRAEQTTGKLESLGVALANMRFDVLRLRTGTGTTANVTLLAEQAMSLARDVDGVLAAEAAVAGRPRGAAARPS